MASLLNNERIIINIPASEIVKNCRFNENSTGGNSEVCAYYLDDDPTKRELLISFFNNFELPFYVDSKAFATYVKEINEFIYKYKNLYVDHMEGFDSAARLFSSHDVQLPSLGISDSRRYLKFDNNSDLVKKFRNSLYEGISNIVIVKSSNRYYIYPELKSLIQLKKDFFKKTGLDFDEVVTASPINNEPIAEEIPDDLEDTSIEEIFKDFLKKKDLSDIYIDRKLQNIKRISKETGKDIYSIYSLDELDDFINKLFSDQYWKELNEKNHNHFSSTMALYREFIKTYFGGKTHSTVDIKVEKATHQPRKNLVNSLNTILYGAPGTGKTYSTSEYALACIENRKPRLNSLTAEQHKEVLTKYNSLVDKGQIVFTTFHQSYGYEEFIQGLRPENVDGHVSFEIKPGVFMKIAQKAMQDPANDYVLIIDEINRGNISRIFGELITLIEPDKRYGEENVIVMTLPYGDSFAVPNNLYIIGTMNSADKSISLIDTALRRRFEFVEKAPNADLITNAVLKEVLVSINDYLRNELKSSDLLIGHSYFLNKSESNLVDILNKNIIPLLYEYFYDDEAKVAKSIEIVKSHNLEIVKQNTKRLFVRNKE